MTKINRKDKKNGFTFIELLIVLALIGILLGLAVPNYTNSVKRAREATLKDSLFKMRTLINQYYTDKGKYPSSLQSLVEEDYLMMIPVDPITKSSETWVEVQETPSEDDLLLVVEPGIVNVHSGSDRTALDGTFYNTW